MDKYKSGESEKEGNNKKCKKKKKINKQKGQKIHGCIKREV